MKKNMLTRFFIHSVIFTLIFFLLLTLVSRIFLPKSNSEFGGYDSGGFYGFRKNTMDILVAGDSNAAEGIAAPLLWTKYGYTCYTAGAPFRSVIGVYYTLEKILKTQQPKVLILETDSLYQDTGMKGLESAAKQIWENNFPVFRYHNRYKSSLKQRDFTKTTDYRWCAPYNGYSPSKTISHYRLPEHFLSETNSRQPISKIQEFYLKLLSDLCRKHNIHLIFMSMLSPKSWSYPMHNAIQDYADRHQIPFIDCNLNYQKYGFEPDQDLRDNGTHQNVYGAVKTAGILADYLKQHESDYNLKDQRKHAEYEQWKRNASRFSTEFSF